MDWKNAGFPGFVQDVKNLGEFDDVFTRTILEKISDDMDTFIVLVAVSFVGWKLECNVIGSDS